jgi:hypothetical protein
MEDLGETFASNSQRDEQEQGSYGRDHASFFDIDQGNTSRLNAELAMKGSHFLSTWGQVRS